MAGAKDCKLNASSKGNDISQQCSLCQLLKVAQLTDTCFHVLQCLVVKMINLADKILCGS